MCDERTVRDNERALARSEGLTRRQFSKLTAGAGLAAVLPAVANAREVSESDLMISTPDGECDCFFVHPAGGAHPGVILWPDILGLRPAFRQMGRRLAQSGYAVLVVNPFYRDARAPVVPEGASFQDQATRDIVLPLYRNLSEQTHLTDARAFVAWLERRDAVDAGAGIGTQGYCMGGPSAIRTAAAAPERVGAVASFHGGGLVTDEPTSPHRHIPSTDAAYLIAIAENDDQNDPEARKVLEATFEQAGLAAEVEVYEGAMHAWCVPDSAVYHQAQAERAWRRLLHLYDNALV